MIEILTGLSFIILGILSVSLAYYYIAFMSPEGGLFLFMGFFLMFIGFIILIVHLYMSED